MFHFLSKIAVLFLSPLVWSITLMLIGLMMKKLRKKLIIGGMIVLYIFSNVSIFQCVITKWEKLALSNSNHKANIAIVLGGMVGWDNTNSRIVFNDASDRYLQALQLLQTNKVEKLVFSGGTNKPHPAKAEADLLKVYSVLMGIPDSLLLVENQSVNTYENARFSSDLFEQQKLPKEIVLVTSGFHMPRATKCFEKQGFVVIPYATHSLIKVDALKPEDYIFPNSVVLYNWNLLIKEWFGLLTYKTVGYI